MKYKIEAVIFDLDGTLIDSMGIWAEVDALYLKKRNIEVPVNLFDDLKDGNSFQEVALYFKEKFNLKETIFEIMEEWTEMVYDYYQSKIKLKDGVIDFLKLLKQNNIKIGVGTSNSFKLAETVLKSNKVFDFFDHIAAGCKNIKGKPFPDIFLEVANNLGVKPEACLVIEDVFAGVLAAKKAGMAVWVIEDKHAKKDFESNKKVSDFYSLDFNEIIDQFKKQL